MKLIPTLIREGRKEDLKKKYTNKFDNEVLDFVLGISDLQDFNHKYTDFILNVLEPEADIDFWVDIAIDLVKDFDKYQSQLKKKDINQYNTFSELEDALEPFHKKEKEKELEAKVKKIYEDDNFLVIIPETQEASCKYGSGTKWCVTQRGTDHFQRYTSGGQKLYFIISKKHSKDGGDYHKIAIHFNQMGDEKWWNTKDDLMSKNEEKLFKDYFGDVYNTIKTHYENNNKTDFEVKAKDVFNEYGNFTNTRNITKGFQMEMYFDGFYENDSNPIGTMRIEIKNEKEKVILTSFYTTHYNYTVNKEGMNVNTAFLNFSDKDEINLNNWSFEWVYNLLPDTRRVFAQILTSTFNQVHDKVKNDPVILEKLIGAKKVWTPDRINYGYTFEQNKGLIKKLINWLDEGKTGTKLKFLVDIGNLKVKMVNNKPVYSHIGYEDYKPSSDFRGQFASFFASAKNAGILDYDKVGNQFKLKKGPNFEAFKKGELKAL